MYNRRTAMLVAGAGLAIAKGAWAQGGSYPSRTITIVVGTAAGGALDLTARLFAQQLSTRLGVSVLVDNKPGANATIAGGLVARARPDGYTLLATSENSVAIAPVLMNPMQYDPRTDLAPVSLMATLPMVLVARADLGIKSVPEFLQLAKKNPGTIRFGSAGDASVHYLGMEVLRRMSRLEMLHVPYRAGPLAMNDLMGGNIDVMLLAAGPAQTQAKAGRLVALGVTSPKRIPSWTELPTIGDTVDGYTFDAWLGLLAPANTPEGVVAKLNSEVRTIMALKEIKDQLAEGGILVETGSPAEFATVIESVRKRVQEIAKR